MYSMKVALYSVVASMLVSQVFGQFGSGLLYCFHNPTEPCCEIYGLTGPCCVEFPHLPQCNTPPPTLNPTFPPSPTPQPTNTNLDPKDPLEP